MLAETHIADCLLIHQNIEPLLAICGISSELYHRVPEKLSHHSFYHAF